MFNQKQTKMKKTTSMSNTSVKTKTASKKAAKTIKALYPVSRVTKSTNSNLWVTYPAGNTSKGLVFSSTLTRDAVRNASRKAFGVNITEVRSRRVKSFRKVS